MSIYSDKLAQMCTREDMLAHNLGAPYFDDVMSYNSLTAIFFIFQMEDLKNQARKELSDW